MKRPLIALLALALLAGCAAKPLPASPAATVTMQLAATVARPVFLIGDSLTEGAYLPDQARDSYPAQVSDLLPDVHVDGRGGRCLVAAGCSYPAALLPTYPAEVAGAGVVVVEIGINDLLHSATTAVQLEAAYTQLISETPASTRLILATITPLAPGQAYIPKTAAASFEQRRLAVNAWLRQSGAEIVDYATVLAGADGALNPAYDCGDGLHPSPAGTAAMAAAVKALI